MNDTSMYQRYDVINVRVLLVSHTALVRCVIVVW